MLTVAKITPAIGAEISSVDFSMPVEPDALETIVGHVDALRP